MSRKLTVFTHRADDYAVLATEVTAGDVMAGMGGAEGDYYVVRPGYAPQWFEREPFNNEFEKSSADAHSDIGDGEALEAAMEEASAAIAALAPAEPPAAAITRETFSATSSAPTDMATLELLTAIQSRLDRLEQLEDALSEQVVGGGFGDRITALETTIANPLHVVTPEGVTGRLDTIEAEFSKLLKVLGVDVSELDAAAAEDESSSSSTSSAPRSARKRGK